MARSSSDAKWLYGNNDTPGYSLVKDRLINMKLIAFESYSVLSPNGYYQILPIDNKAPDYSKQITQKLTDKLFRE
jgi:hypothetical protein